MLTVTDDGSGMTPEVKARLFEPFFTTKEQGKGTGLGLAVAHGIVRQSGGNIEVESAPGAGTTFRIYLPALVDAEDAPEARAAAAAPVAGHERVLVVEDEETVRELAVILLRRLGYDVLVAADGNAALHMAREFDGPIDLLLTDVLMPGMSGPQLAAGITAQRPGLRVLFMSGYAPDAMLRDGILEGEVEVLNKPFSAQRLASRVREVLSAPKPARVSASGGR
jgi:CheY-like chemotaxis protein